jgi:TRAP transporter TAXI family solute receptor
MKKILISLAAALAFAASAAPVGIASGQMTGTNYPMAQDIVNVCSTKTSPISNIVSDGSLDNLAKVYGDKNSQYGIVQADALVYQKGVDPKMMDRIKGVFPLFTSEIHLVVRADSKINSLADLRGKRIVEGPDGSGTWVTVQVIKGLTGLQWTAMNASQAQGLAAVQSGQADALFVNAGRPIGMLSSVPSGIRLISMTHPKLDQFNLYTKSMIPSGTYPFQKTSIQTYKVDNLMVTYAFDSQYQKEIGDLVSCIVKNIDTLQKTGHPKWREVDVTDVNRINWPMHKAAVAAVNKEMKNKK